MRIFSAQDAAKKFGALLEAAAEAPVAIHRNGRPRAAIVSWRRFEDYERALKQHSEAQLLDTLSTALDLLSAGKLGKGERALALALARRLGVAAPSEADTKTAGKLLAAREK
ncbi:MAG: type II toxin-antitoxin system Phd/YefM family antitoxin [Parvularculaceae bacterium]|nr:type II toxin-antitoxin system Phd/YefM family antitoxin [Parvularculaceae bacterium]